MNRRGFLRAVGAAVVLLGGQAPAAHSEALPDDTERIRQALRERKLMEFTYHGYARRVEPHALGLARDEHGALLGWQVAGGSKSEPPPGWRTFLLEDISGLRVTEERFQPRPDYNPERTKLKRILAEVAPAAN